MSRCAFTDPATGVRYQWTRNYEEESSSSRTRAIATVEPTAAGWAQVEPVRLQGAAEPRTRRYTGKADDATHLIFARMYALSQTQSVIFEDIDGSRTEVFVTGYDPTRVGVVRTIGNANHYRSYTLDMEEAR